MAENGSFRVIILHNDGTQESEVVEAPSYFDLAVEVAKKRIRSFTVTLA